jgi:hypothetical protein
MKWWLDVPPLATGKFYGLLIQQHEAPRDWPTALDRVPEALRPVAERYLRDIARRMRTAKEANGDDVHRA